MATDYEMEMRWDGGQKIILPIKTIIDDEPEGCHWIVMDEEEILKLLDGDEEAEVEESDVDYLLPDDMAHWFFEIDSPNEYYIRRIT